jgi:hypothetical protein
MRGDEEMGDRYDALIDRALRSYAEPAENPEPRVVIGRVMARARETETGLKWPFWSWAIPATCVVAVMLAAAWLLRTPQVPEVAHAPGVPQIIAQAKPFVPAGRSIRAKAAPKRALQVLAAKSEPLAKLDVFPTPTPLSPEEQALATFATHGPHEVQQAVLEDQKHWDDPIIVAELQEQPVQRGKQQIQ